MKQSSLIPCVSKSLALVEAAHRSGGSLEDWCEELLRTARPLFATSDLPVTILSREVEQYRLEAISSTSLARAGFMRAAISMPAKMLDPYARLKGYVATVSEIQDYQHQRAEVPGFPEAIGGEDMLGLVGLAGKYSLTLGVPLPTRARVSAAERLLLTRLMLHVELGLRLRVAPTAPIAWVHSDGRVLHAEGIVSNRANQRQALADHVRSVERLRVSGERRRVESVHAWTALVEGNWALVEHQAGYGSRAYSVHPTETTSHLRALSDAEARAVELSARGVPGKNVAYALGTSESTVSKLLTRASLKTGIANRTELVRLASVLLGCGPKRGKLLALTEAEQDILALIRLGWTNEAIARQRKRSERTVANQIARLLNKLGLPSRRALAAAEATKITAQSEAPGGNMQLPSHS